MGGDGAVQYPRPEHRQVGGEVWRKGEAGWERGIWLGKAEENDEHLIGTGKGMIRARSIRRLTKDKSADKDLFEEIKGVPWDMKLRTSGPRPKITSRVEPRAVTEEHAANKKEEAEEVDTEKKGPEEKPEESQMPEKKEAPEKDRSEDVRGERSRSGHEHRKGT